MSPIVKNSLHWVGSALAIAGIVFVAMRLNDHRSQLDFSHFDSLMWSAMAGLALVYGLANTVLALAWQNLLMHFGVDVHRLWAVRIYGLTQLAKYIPGNIMHLAGRQAMGLADDIPGWPLAKASVWELGLISIAGALFFVLVLPQFLPIVTVAMAILGFVAVLLILVLVLKRYMSLAVSRAFGWYVVFLVISGIVFVGLLILLKGVDFVTPLLALTFCGAFIVAWLVGLATPGAPAGIGARELALTVLLKGLVNEADLVWAVLMSRVVTVIGDVLFFLLASWLANRRLSVVE